MAQQRDIKSELAGHLEKIGINPLEANNYIQAALCLYELKRYQAAELMALEAAAVENAAQDPVVLYLIATIMEARNIPSRRESMLRFYERFIALEESNPEPRKSELSHAYNMLGKECLRTKRPGMARIAFTRAAQFAPESYETHYNMAALELQDGLLDDAQAHLEKCRELSAWPERKPIHIPGLCGLQRQINRARVADPAPE